MKCSCCNKTLNNYESTLRHAETGEFLDTCSKCLKGLGIPVTASYQHNPFEETEDPEMEFEDEDREWS